MPHKSWKQHYEKKYPGGKVVSNESAVDVFDSAGSLRVALRKDGHGNMVCKSAEHGALDAHDLAPLPAKVKEKHMDSGKMKVHSCDYLEKAKVDKFDENQRAIKDEDDK